MTRGVCTLAGDFRSLLWDVEWCLLVKDHYLLSWYGLLEIRVKDITKQGGHILTGFGTFDRVSWILHPVRKDGKWWNVMTFLVCCRHVFRVCNMKNTVLVCQVQLLVR